MFVHRLVQRTSSMKFTVVHGDLVDQDVEVIVNAWNRNIFPWWLLIPQGVSKAIKRRAGLKPFNELFFKGPIPLGGAVVTSPGRLPHRAIIHVAGINLLWRSSERSIRRATRSALELARVHGFVSVALPLIGAGTGGGGEERVLDIMKEELRDISFPGDVRLVVYRPGARFTPGQTARRRARG